MGDVINLGQRRKARARAEAKARADQNAVAHGRTKADKQHQEATRRQSARDLEGHRLEGVPPEEVGSDDGATDGDTDPDAPDPS